MDDGFRLSLPERHIQRLEHQLGAQMGRHRPANDAAAPGVQRRSRRTTGLRLSISQDGFNYLFRCARRRRQLCQSLKDPLVGGAVGTPDVSEWRSATPRPEVPQFRIQVFQPCDVLHGVHMHGREGLLHVLDMLPGPLDQVPGVVGPEISGGSEIICALHLM